MPSWNIHTAHVERLLSEEGRDALGIRDVDAFLMGNLLPDIYVGYMVPDATMRIDYKLTHLTLRHHIPVPRHQEFWDFYCVDPAGYGTDEVTDVVKGAWCHLVCDSVYNTHTRARLAQIGVAAGEKARIGKQSDFADFGRTLSISMKPRVTQTVIDQCAAFPMYRVAKADVHSAANVASRIVDENIANHLDGEPSYRLLTADFFEIARAEAHVTMLYGLRNLAC
ncbi:hypothetical protein [Paratractidigestivibacter sp.]|uniref:hypothetical protein n=1 Tax=Paratractidigestivibacter sp. TaxID=2847316 RepID=UPI002ABD8154|nr:hypothetical protein [Paratractidigestivibacter sp.]